MNPGDFFHWGYVKEKLFPKCPASAMQLRALIVKMCCEIMDDKCRRVITKTAIRVSEVGQQNCAHMEYVIHTG
jgi:hypothetical protein